MVRFVTVSAFLGMAVSWASAQDTFHYSTQEELQTLEGVTYANEAKRVYVPVRELGQSLKIYVGWDEEAKRITLDEKPVDPKSVRKLYDGTNMVDVLTLGETGVTVKGQPGQDIRLSTWRKAVKVTVPEKWVEISLDSQRLMAWQGERLVMDTNVSTGRRGFRTPTGSFTAGPEKSRHRVSRTYDNSPMPYSIQLYKGYFIHGYPSVPSYPASHGCIRMPLGKKNAASYLFDWIDLGTPVEIRNEWSEKVEALLERDQIAEQSPSKTRQ